MSATSLGPITPEPQAGLSPRDDPIFVIKTCHSEIVLIHAELLKLTVKKWPKLPSKLADQIHGAQALVHRSMMPFLSLISLYENNIKQRDVIRSKFAEGAVVAFKRLTAEVRSLSAACKTACEGRAKSRDVMKIADDKENLDAIGSQREIVGRYCDSVEKMARTTRSGFFEAQSRIRRENERLDFYKSIADAELEKSQNLEKDLTNLFAQSSFHMELSVLSHDSEMARFMARILGVNSEDQSIHAFVKMCEKLGRMWVEDQTNGQSALSFHSLEDLHSILASRVIDSLDMGFQSDGANMAKSELEIDAELFVAQVKRWDELSQLKPLVIAFGGHFSHGKSSILNALMGEQILPTAG